MKKSAEETVRELDTNAAAGISRQEAARRRARYGANETTKKPDRGASSGGIGAMMLPAAILAAAAVLCLLTKDYLSAAVVFGSALVTAGLKGYSLARIRRVLTSIAAVTAPMSTVVRDGVPEIIETVQLVPGDLVQLRAGDIIGADMRLVESISLVMDESIPARRLYGRAEGRRRRHGRGRGPLLAPQYVLYGYGRPLRQRGARSSLRRDATSPRRLRCARLTSTSAAAR